MLTFVIGVHFTCLLMKKRHDRRKNSSDTSYHQQTIVKLLQKFSARTRGKESNCFETCKQHQKEQNLSAQKMEQVRYIQSFLSFFYGLN